LDKESIIQQIFARYARLSPADWELISPLVGFQNLSKGSFFIRPGAYNDQLGVVMKGCLRYFYLKEGEEITGEFWQEGEIIGSFESCILRQPSTLYIEAIEPCEIITLSYPKLKELTVSINQLDKIIIALLEKFIVESQLRIASYITETPEQRYLRLRDEMPNIEERVHQKYIASFVGVTPVTLSRIRGRLAKGN
jgi:CRP-like cAMP-binding protein